MTVIQTSIITFFAVVIASFVIVTAAIIIESRERKRYNEQ